ncbi:fibrous sheath CABYR-binding protein isoform X2 [Bicyclus anynana]|uniref:Fibrous sheath CABYR-binding protein isoform X2 n=1 Tax=Bicyclus anynana TaxID=110368 RepID=A0ABM3LMD4_BICAN|nr:fibrous sheath CABYR-binding protein isoform X2 [Bicyclus anynana]
MSCKSWFTTQDALQDLNWVAGGYVPVDFNEDEEVFGYQVPPRRYMNFDHETDEQLERLSGGYRAIVDDSAGAPDLAGIKHMLRLVEDSEEEVEDEVPVQEPEPEPATSTNVVIISKLNPEVKEFVPKSGADDGKSLKKEENVNDKTEILNTEEKQENKVEVETDEQEETEVKEKTDEHEEIVLEEVPRVPPPVPPVVQEGDEIGDPLSTRRVDTNRLTDSEIQQMRTVLQRKINDNWEATCMRNKCRRNVAIVTLLKLHCKSPSSTPVGQEPNSIPPSLTPVEQAPNSIPPSLTPVEQPPNSIPPSLTPVEQAPNSIPPSLTPVEQPPNSIPPSLTPVEQPPNLIPPSLTPVIQAPNLIPPSLTPVEQPPNLLPPPCTPVEQGPKFVRTSYTPGEQKPNSIPPSCSPVEQGPKFIQASYTPVEQGPKFIPSTYTLVGQGPNLIPPSYFKTVQKWLNNSEYDTEVLKEFPNPELCETIVDDGHTSELCNTKESPKEPNITVDKIPEKLCKTNGYVKPIKKRKLLTLEDLQYKPKEGTSKPTSPNTTKLDTKISKPCSNYVPSEYSRQLTAKYEKNRQLQESNQADYKFTVWSLVDKKLQEKDEENRRNKACDAEKKSKESVEEPSEVKRA